MIEGHTSRAFDGALAALHVHVLEMGGLVLDQVRESLDTLDRGHAAAVATHDRELDREYAAGLRRLLTRAVEHPREIEIALESAFALKALERIGDHARNLARQVRAIGGDAP